MLICLISTCTLMKLLFCIKMLGTRYIGTLLLQFGNFADLWNCASMCGCLCLFSVSG